MVSSRRKEKVHSSIIASVIMAGIGAIFSGCGIYSFSYGFSHAEYILQAYPQSTGVWATGTIAAWGADMMFGAILAALGTFFIIYSVYSLLIASPPGFGGVSKKNSETLE